MAITKNHAIDTTLKTAIDYILNPAKTDGKLLVSSFGCSPETADLEFERTRQYAIDKGKHLARHIIQSFEPGETTPEQAHEIGVKLANEIFDGRFEFIVSTHIDRGHIHNHIICNDVSFVDYKHIHINKNGITIPAVSATEFAANMDCRLLNRVPRAGKVTQNTQPLRTVQAGRQS